jgi:hypothetical protein
MRHKRGPLVRPRMSTILFLLLGFVVLFTVRPACGDIPVLVQQASLIAEDPVEQSYLGSSVAISGDTAVGGAPGFGSVGEAYVFVRGETGWSQQQKLIPDSLTIRSFGKAVAIDGDTIVIGAPFDVSGAPGSAYVFVRNGTIWALQARLTARDGSQNNHFGSSVALSGETALIGSSRAAYVFVRNGSSWSEQRKLIPGDHEGAFFGFSVALDGDTAVVGDPTYLASSVYVFARSGTSWSQVQKLTASDAAAANNFGYAVAIRGETLVAGAPFDDSAGYRAGSAYVFVKSGAGWVQERKLTPADRVLPGDLFGKEFGGSVATDGEMVLAAARYDSTGLGAVYVFGRSGTSWSQLQKLTSEGASSVSAFGLSVAISGEMVAIGSGYHGRGYGAVYIFGPTSNHPPVADAGPDQILECVLPAAARARLDGTRSYDPDGDPLGFLWTGPFGQASGASPMVQVPLGSSTATLTVADGSGATDTDDAQIIVQDTNAPGISSGAVFPNRLWPPNREMVPVSVLLSVSDLCDQAVSCAVETVTSNEPIEGDFEITGPLTLKLRAERQDAGPGRTYSIVLGCQDSSGNRSATAAEVFVPHDQGQ